jgi:MFS family permease
VLIRIIIELIIELKSSRKALIIGIVLVTVNQLCGCFAFINYTAEIFRQSGSSLSPNESAIIIAFIQLIGSGVSTVLIERWTRKFLFTLSCCGTVLGLLAFGTHGLIGTLIEDLNMNWIPIVSMAFVILVASCGLMPLTFIMLSEVLPPNVINL